MRVGVEQEPGDFKGHYSAQSCVSFSWADKEREDSKRGNRKKGCDALSSVILHIAKTLILVLLIVTFQCFFFEQILLTCEM